LVVLISTTKGAAADKLLSEGIADLKTKLN
jgi:hypothetical protein